MTHRLLAATALAALAGSALADATFDRGPGFDVIADLQARSDGRIATTDRDGTAYLLAVDKVAFEKGDAVRDPGTLAWCVDTSRGLDACEPLELDLVFGARGTEYECFGSNVPILGGYCFCLGTDSDDCDAMLSGNACADDGAASCDEDLDVCACET